MANTPPQTISPGHRRRIGVTVFRNNIDPITGVNTPVVDTTSDLILTTNRSDAVTASVDPTNKRKVILTAVPLFGAAIGWTVTVSADVPDGVPPGATVGIPGTTQPVSNLNHIDWDGTQEDI